MPASRSDQESGVTPVIGTVLVLAITVIGIMTAMLFGAPVIQRVQDQAATEEMVGQLRNVQHSSQVLALPGSSRITGVSIAGGDLVLTEGSQFLVLETLVSECTPTVTSWANGDGTLSISGAGCTVTSVSVQKEDGTPVSTTVLSGTCTAPAASCSFTLTAPEIFGRATHQVTYSNGGTPIAKAWIMGTDRLHWERGSGAVDLEGGTLLSTESGGIYRVAGPRVDEAGGSAMVLSLPLLRAESYGLIHGSGDHVVATTLEQRTVWEAGLNAYRVRVDVAGDLAEPWCNSFMIRNAAATITGAAYASINANCATLTSDGASAVSFTRTGGTAFPFTFGQGVIDVELQV